jgi:hypothetical protein
MKKTISSLTAIALVFVSLAIAPVNVANAASMTVDQPVNAAANAGASTEVMVHWTISAPGMSAGNKIYLKLKSATTSNQVNASTSPCTSGAGATTTIAGSGNYSVLYGYGTTTVTLGASAAAAQTATTCVKLPTGLAAGNYYISIGTEGSGDALASLLYIGGANVVTVTADVEANLSFSLDKNSCDLGVLTSAAASTCTYSATTSSNAATGAGAIVVNASANNSGNLNDGGTNNINAVAAGSCVAMTGPSGGQYGFRVVSTSTVDWNTATVYDDCAANQARQLPSSPTAILTTATAFSAAGGNTASFTIEHLAQAGPDSKVGNYTSQVTYTVTLAF